ncbi:hypothetical protein HDU96_005567 [Phlyctochytrium bullatum]|nr:hypothetical protein HDU96_005567 [Phlyctochytrium bullatum]
MRMRLWGEKWGYSPAQPSSGWTKLKNDELRPTRIEAMRTAVKKRLWPTVHRDSGQNQPQLHDAVLNAAYMRSLELLGDLRTIFHEFMPANAKSTPLCLFFFAAAGTGFTDGLRLIPPGDPILAARDSVGETLLHRAVRSRNLDCVRLLLDLGASANGQAGDAANEAGNDSVDSERFGSNLVRPLENDDWSSDEESDEEDSDHLRSPLDLALKFLDNDFVRPLLEHGAALTRYGIGRKTPYHRAIIKDDVEALKLLLEFHPCVDLEELNLSLIYAIKERAKECMDILLNLGASLDEVDEKGFKTLLKVCHEQQRDPVMLLLNNGMASDVLHRCSLFPSLLHFSLNMDPEYPDLHLLKLLVEGGAPLNVTDSGGRTPLYYALTNYQTNAAVILLQAGADPSFACHAGHTPLFIVCIRYVFGNEVNRYDDDDLEPMVEERLKKGGAGCASLKLVQLLLDAGAAVNGRSPRDISAIEAVFFFKRDVNKVDLAFYQRRLDVIRVLVSRGANAECGNRLGDDARGFLHQAIDDKTHRTRSELVSLLVRARAPLNVQDEWGRTPLHRSVMARRADDAWVLLEGGADPSVCCSNGKKPLHCLMEYMEFDQLVAKMIEAGADVDLRDSDGRTALHLASEHGYLEKMIILLDAGADIEAVDRFGFTPLRFACTQWIRAWQEKTTKPMLNIVMLLIYRGASLDNVFYLLHDLLYSATLTDDCELLSLLLEAEAPVNALCGNGETPLHGAMRKSNTEAAMLLLQNGADPNARSLWDSTPLHTLAAFHVGKVPELVLAKMLEAGLDLNAVDSRNRTALHVAARNSRLELLLWLLRREDVEKSVLDDDEVTWEDMLDKGNWVVDEWLENHNAEIASAGTDGKGEDRE